MLVQLDIYIQKKVYPIFYHIQKSTQMDWRLKHRPENVKWLEENKGKALYCLENNLGYDPISIKQEKMKIKKVGLHLTENLAQQEKKPNRAKKVTEWKYFKIMYFMRVKLRNINART